MTTQKPHLLTEEGLQRLTEELKYLTTVKREEVAERLHSAFEDGQDDDFVENAGLEAARNEQAFLEGRIQELTEVLANYQIIEDNDEHGHDFVRVGDWVTIVEVGIDDEERYHIVGPAEADPAKGRVSNESPLGKALMGARVGDTVRVNAPNGIIEFEIMLIE